MFGHFKKSFYYYFQDARAIARLCINNPKLHILTWDEYAKDLGQRLQAAADKLDPSGDSGKAIMAKCHGIRDIKVSDWFGIKACCKPNVESNKG